MVSKFLKRALIVIGVLVLTFFAYVEISGNQFLYKTFGNTLFKGRLGPTIDDHNLFESRMVEAGNYQEWPVDSNYNKFQLSTEEEEVHTKFETVSLVVIKSGKLYFEKYWQGYSDSSLTNSWSMSKSLISRSRCSSRSFLMA